MCIQTVSALGAVKQNETNGKQSNFFLRGKKQKRGVGKILFPEETYS